MSSAIVVLDILVLSATLATITTSVTPTSRAALVTSAAATTTLTWDDLEIVMRKVESVFNVCTTLMVKTVNTAVMDTMVTL